MYASTQNMIECFAFRFEFQRARRRYWLASTWLATVLALTVGSGAFASESGLPSGGKVVAGSASINTAGSSTHISQASPTAIIDWTGFSIAAGDSVTFNNGTGSTLNRVIGSSVSKLDGVLSATGSIYLINPNGVIIGKSGVIKTGGSFVASALNVSDANYLQGGDLTFSGESTALVTNLGKVGALGGDVTLIAAEVENDGVINAAAGRVGLVAGHSILMRDAAVDDGRFTVVVGGLDTSVTTRGAITAAAAALLANGGNVYALAGNTQGIINAIGVSQSDGKVFLTAGADGRIKISGATLQASTSSGNGGEITLSAKTIDVTSEAQFIASATSSKGQGGSIIVAADKSSGHLKFSGQATAKGGRSSGDGGFVETSGSLVNFAGASINTSAPKGQTGTWLVSSDGLTVKASAAAAIQANLATTNVTLQTVAPDEAPMMGGHGVVSGDINIKAPISWSSNNVLTLNSYGAISLSAPITIRGAGGVNLNTDGGGEGGALDFGLGPKGFAANITFADKPHSGQSLIINGNVYTLLYSVSDLAALNGGTGYYALAKALDAKATLYTTALVPSFSGTLDGLGHTIANLTIAGANSSSPVGLIGSLSGTVKDLGLVSGSVSGQSEVGSVAGYMRFATISDVFSTNKVTGSGIVGGLVGLNDFGGQITNAFETGNVVGQSITGGMVGENYGSVALSHSTGAVTAPGQYTGGLVGANYGGVSSDYATGAVKGGAETGGLVGYSLGGGVIGSYATGSVTGTTDTGGLVGNNDLAVISNAYSTGTVTGQTNSGGLVGVNYGQISNTFATGAVRGKINTGGLVGQNGFGAIIQSYSIGKVSGQVSTGGLIGLGGGGTETDDYWDVSTSGQTVSAGGVGLFTAQLKGALPPGFDASVWGTGKGLYPYLRSFVSLQTKPN